MFCSYDRKLMISNCKADPFPLATPLAGANTMAREALFGSGGPTVWPPWASWGLHSQGHPAQQVMGHGYQEHDRRHFGNPPHRELGDDPMLAHLSIRPFSRGGTFLVDRLSILCGHALPPCHHFRAVPVPGLVAHLLRFIPWQSHRGVHRDAPFIQSGDVIPSGKPTVHYPNGYRQVSRGVLAGPPHHLLLHLWLYGYGRRLAGIRALRG